MLRTSFATALFALLACFPAHADGLARHFTAAKPGEDVPAFLFQDAKGKDLRLSDFHGTAVLLNLWATWCAPCVDEMPTLDKLQSMMGSRLAIVALDEEHGGGGEVAKTFFARHGINNLALYNDPTGRIASQLQARGLPTSLLIDSNGHLIGRVEGGVDWSAPDVVDFISKNVN